MVVPLYEIRKDDVHDRDPYKMYKSQDPNFDPFADLDLILPTMGDREGNTSDTDEEEREVDDDTDRNMEGNSGHVVEIEGEE
ncbi:hypothetical protein Tco_1477799, partial [Tanacetum coccineum]